MKKSNWSRRKFLQMVSGLSFVPVMGGLQKFFPEINSSYRRGDAKLRSVLQIPDDLVMHAFDEEKSAKIVSRALNFSDSRTLVKSLPSFQPVTSQAHVTDMSWANGTQKATVISIPFKDPQNNIAVLQCVMNDAVAEINVVQFLDKEDWTSAKIHTIKNGNVSIIDANLHSIKLGEPIETQASACTAQTLIQCLGLWGCSGLALATCAAGLILCPFTIWSCIAVYTCSLYCGGAWSYCFCWACGC